MWSITWNITGNTASVLMIDRVLLGRIRVLLRTLGTGSSFWNIDGGVLF